MPARQPLKKDEDWKDKENAQSKENKAEKTAEEINDEWRRKTATEKPVAIDTSLTGVVTLARKNLDAALLAVDSAYLAVYNSSLNNKDSVLTTVHDVREDLANAVVSLGGLG